MHRVSFQTSADNVQMRGWFEDVARVALEGVSRELWRSVENHSSSSRFIAYWSGNGEMWSRSASARGLQSISNRSYQRIYVPKLKIRTLECGAGR